MKFLMLFLFATLCTSCLFTPKADLILTNGKIVTVDKNFSIQEAVAITADKIIYVGTSDDVKKFRGKKTQFIDLDGMFVTPGMTDAHGHPFNLGNDEQDDWFSVSGTKSWQDVVTLVAQKAKSLEKGEWIIGGGWYQDDWEDNSIPVHDALSAVTPENPVFLYRRGGNSAFVNAKALEIAGITEDTPDPYGGKIGRKPGTMEPSGFMVNMANNMVHKHFPKPDKPLDWYEEQLTTAARKFHECGLTGWHDAGIDPILIDAYKSMVDKGTLNIRVNAMLQNPREGNLEEYYLKYRIINYGNHDMFQVRSVKMFFDGALGSRGAALFEDYNDSPGDTGVFEVPPEHVFEVSIAALKTGMQVCPHSIGSRANNTILNEFERALKKVPVEDHRFRSEHAELISPDDVERFASLGVIPSVQPIHHTSDMEFLPDRIGEERCALIASPWRSLIDAGCILPCGSDFAIYSHNPLTGIYAAVTRKNEDGTPKDGYYQNQCMTREEAIKGYTIWPAYAAFLEDKVGSIEVGKYADISVFDKDLLTISEEEILQTKAMYTIVGGKIVYQR